MPKILVVDDQRNMRTTLAMMLRGAGYEVDEAGDGNQGADMGARGAYNVVLTDLRMGQFDGIRVLRSVKESHAATEVIVMTAYGTIESAVEAMRLGAFDYIQKPFSEQELLLKVDRANKNRQLSSRSACFASEFKEKYKFENIAGRSQAIREVLGRIVKVAPTDATVLITGESGTGKELVAKAIHANSKRAERPVRPRQLRGHHARPCWRASSSATRAARSPGRCRARKGLFEEADGGTFFFDEIAETPLTFQAKLLRAIQENEIRRVGENKPIRVNVRIIAATNQELLGPWPRSASGRISTTGSTSRASCCPRCASGARTSRCSSSSSSPSRTRRWAPAPASATAWSRRWSSTTTRATSASSRTWSSRRSRSRAGASITVDDLLPAIVQPNRPAGGGRTLANVVDAAERQAIEAALREHDGSREKAAEALAISPTTLWRKMTRLAITYPPSLG